MGVYIPPCGDVQCSVNVCVCDIATVRAVKVLAVPNTNVTAIMASLRGIGRRDGNNLDAINLALVFKERTELIETPRVASSTKRLVAFLGVHTPSDILQVLNGNTFVFFPCFRYNLLAYAVIDNSGKSSLTSFQPFQQLMTVASAFGLNRSSHFVVSISYVFDFFGRYISSVRQRNDIGKAHVYTNEILCGFFFLIGDVYRLIQIEFPFDENKVSFAFRILHESWTVASICYLLTTTNKRNGTYRLGDVIGKHTAIISDSTKLPKVPLLFSVEFVCVGNLADCTHNELRRKMICFFNRIIGFLMQAELLEDMTFPRYLGDSVASLVENAECLFQYRGLFFSWKQFNLQGQFHNTKIQNSFGIFKYLKEIIILSLTKEGMMAQFLPEAKDFGVSLSRVI